MDYPSKIKALEQRSSYFGKWQNEVAERLPGKKTASMESMVPLQRKPWRMQGCPYRGREA